jgi:hypothetical protein
MSYQPAPPVVGSFGLGDAYAPPPPVGVNGLFDSIVNAVTGGGNPVAAAAQSLAPAVSAAIGGQSAANPNQTWQKWQ